ncbi:MAG: hypothetical protein IT429_01765 [Gemmataceae bacterium]|nr:hypothetical protein [Gemmataceae bacterium]
MARSARVTSLEQLEALKAALCRFTAAAQNALAGVEVDLHRVADWLDQQTDDWRRAVTRREELLVRAKGDLTLRRYSAGGDRVRDCSEQEMAVKRAEAALHHARQKLDACRRWSRTLPRELEECRGPTSQLASLLDADLRQAVAFLEQKLRALEGYVAVAPADAPPKS